MEPIDELGVFWLPGNETDTLSGRLQFDPAGDGIKLELVGEFDNSAVDDDKSAVRLMGWAGKNPVTLDQAYRSSANRRAPGVIDCRYSANRMFIGHHLDEWQLAFKRAIVTISDLDVWVGRSGITQPSNLARPASTEGVEYEMRYVPLPKESCRFSRGDVTLGFSWKSSGDPLHGVALRQWPYIEVHYDEIQDFAAIRADAGRLQSLVALCIDAPASIDSLVVSRPDIHSQMLDGSDSGHEQLIEFVAQPLRYIDPGKRKPRQQYRMLINYDDLGGVEAIAAWLESSERFERALNSLMSVKRAERMYVENRFLNVTFAAEAFHRTTRNVTHMEASAFASLFESYLASTPDEYHEWLRGKIEYGNEPPLRKRLQQLAADSAAATRPLIGDKGRWAYTLSRVRNELTHVGIGSREFEGRDLFFLAESVYAVVRICMLLESGVPIEALSRKASDPAISWYRDRLQQSIERVRKKLQE